MRCGVKGMLGWGAPGPCASEPGRVQGQGATPALVSPSRPAHFRSHASSLPASLPPSSDRAKFVDALRERFAHLDLTFSIGGQISFDVFPRVRAVCLSVATIRSKEMLHAVGTCHAVIVWLQPRQLGACSGAGRLQQGTHGRCRRQPRCSSRALAWPVGWPSFFGPVFHITPRRRAGTRPTACGL